MTKYIAQFFGLLVLCASVASAQEFQRPLFKPGDSWLSEKVDLSKRGRPIIESIEHTFVENVGGTLKFNFTGTVDGSRVQDAIERNEDLGTIKFRGAVTPGANALPFPLSVGKSWTVKVGDSTRGRTQLCKVLRVVDVTVKAGTFKTLEINCDGSYNNSNGHQSWQGQIVTTRWYAPDVGWDAKVTYLDTGPQGTWNNWVMELVRATRAEAQNTGMLAPKPE